MVALLGFMVVLGPSLLLRRRRGVVDFGGLEDRRVADCPAGCDGLEDRCLLEECLGGLDDRPPAEDRLVCRGLDDRRVAEERLLDFSFAKSAASPVVVVSADSTAALSSNDFFGGLDDRRELER